MAAVAPDRTNVCGHGAIPNDGSDDTLAINNAINAATPTPTPGTLPSRSIYFPPGTYMFTGKINLAPNTSYRFYGDGPGVSTILFSTNPMNPSAGINGPNMGMATLNVEGLTLMANSTNCGTAIAADFTPGAKSRTAAIHNVQIVGSTRTGTTGGYWTNGINLNRASNTVIDKVHIAGNKSATQAGIIWRASDSNATGLQMSNLEIKWCNKALSTEGDVEGIYLTAFEFISCGRGTAGTYAVDLQGRTIHLVNGQVDSVGSGLKLTNQNLVKISNVSFTHSGGTELVDATMLWINGGFDATVTECSFDGVSGIPPDAVAQENGIYLTNAHAVRLAGNNFSNMRPGNGSCIVADVNSTLVRITDNLFSNVYNKITDQNTDPNDPYYNGNFPVLP